MTFNDNDQVNGEANYVDDDQDDTTTDNNCCNNTIDNILNKVSDNMGMKPIPSRYKPVRTNYHRNSSPTSRRRATPQACNSSPYKRSNSTDILSSTSSNTTGIRRRHTTIRRNSIMPGNETNIQINKQETRQSFELKNDALYSMAKQTDNHTLENDLSLIQSFQIEQEYNSSQNFWIRLAIQSSSSKTSFKDLVKRSTFLVISVMTVGAGVLWGLMYVALGEWLAALMPFIYSTTMSGVLFTCICQNKNVISGMEDINKLNSSGVGRRSRSGSINSSTANSSTTATTSSLTTKSKRTRKRKGYDTFVTYQLALILLLPFAVHVALGGIEKSGGVMLWSFLCPMGAAFFRSATESIRWFKLYMIINCILLVYGFWDITNDNEGTVYLEGVEGSSSSSSETTIQKLYWLMNIIGVKCVIFAAVFLFALELEKEYTKSEEVLGNILPSSIVKRIKRGEFPIVDHVAGTTILFADLVGFTKASTELHPNFLIGLFLRDIFQEFDDLVYKHGLEKIKTIGDAYMVVGGLNHSGEELSEQSQSQSAKYEYQPAHATNTMFMAMEMFTALDKINQKYNLSFDLRIGVHTGPVVAGVLGLKRFTYDVWGDSVNTASRMESNGVPAMVHLSEDMYQSVCDMDDMFDFSCCGKLEIKGKGEMTTYLALPHAAKDDNIEER